MAYPIIEQGRLSGLVVWDGTNWVALNVDAQGKIQIDAVTTSLDDALASVGTDQLRVDVISSALPTGAATAAKQDTMITALQLIDDLTNALNSVGTDEIEVVADGGGQIWNWVAREAGFDQNTNLTAGTNTLSSGAVGAGYAWRVTNLAAKYDGTRPDDFIFYALAGGQQLVIDHVMGPPPGQWMCVQCDVLLTAGDYVKVDVNGATAGDTMTFDWLAWAGYL